MFLYIRNLKRIRRFPEEIRRNREGKGGGRKRKKLSFNLHYGDIVLVWEEEAWQSIISIYAAEGSKDSFSHPESQERRIGAIKKK